MDFTYFEDTLLDTTSISQVRVGILSLKGSCPKLKSFPLTFDFSCLVLEFSKTLNACTCNT